MIKKIGFNPSGEMPVSYVQPKKKDDVGELNKVSKPTKPDKPQGEPPWFALMEELGLSPTGSKEGDYSAIIDKISQIEAAATTEEKKAEISALRSSVEELFSSSTQGAEKPEKVSAFAGQNQLAALNKHFMIN